MFDANDGQAAPRPEAGFTQRLADQRRLRGQHHLRQAQILTSGIAEAGVDDGPLQVLGLGEGLDSLRIAKDRYAIPGAHDGVGQRWPHLEPGSL